MFKFLKEKLKNTISKISKKVEEAKEEVKEASIKEIEEKSVKQSKKGLVKKFKEKITTKKLSQKQFEEIFYDLEITLLENNVALDVVEKIKEDLKEDLIDKPIKRSKVQEIITSSLKKSIQNLFTEEKIDLIKLIKNKKEKPFVIVFFGVNGSGKTTTIAKIAKLCRDNKLSVVLGAGDSFRAAGIHQIEEWGKRLNVKVIKHDYGADPAAICFDTISFGKSHNIDVVLLDTAGRQHSNVNLMEEMKKIVRVAKPDLKILVAESIVGNDAVEQAQIFDEAIHIDGIILTKVDVDEKGGAMISVSYVTKKPIIYLSVGQQPKDIEEFNQEKIVSSLGL